ncbi:DMT family transporter [Nocardioides marmorisolisilvae]|uniref:QacE family quaternary ammonium compound efflux SMR transporter n=1 Tax=Nocardioides marmorisolisilvae TaxID=1542737 RepID=A0A3N0DZE6_9ACTN|nr:multidrug efflux SMR transporter [Nocardioides marmorisolisilvae]RNL80988.1 QacE family quaternary ammonium compound efflux SMR transporter [Nocardioides marmorisolisilvae]
MWGAAVLLAVAIGVEVGATALLPKAHGFTDPFWSVVVVTGYGLSIWMLALVVRSMPVSVAYAVWAGVGTAAVAVIGMIFLGESMGWVKAASLAMIIAGVVGLNMVGTHG